MNRRSFIKSIFGILLVALGFKSIASVPIVIKNVYDPVQIPKGYEWESESYTMTIQSITYLDADGGMWVTMNNDFSELEFKAHVPITFEFGDHFEIGDQVIVRREL